MQVLSAADIYDLRGQLAVAEVPLYDERKVVEKCQSDADSVTDEEMDNVDDDEDCFVNR